MIREHSGKMLAESFSYIQSFFSNYISFSQNLVKKLLPGVEIESEAENDMNTDMNNYIFTN